MRSIQLFAVALCIVLAWPRPTAACSVAYVDLFTRFDQAKVVGVGRSRLRTTGGPFVTVETTLKGTALSTLSFDARGKCGPRLDGALRVIAFADARGQAIDFTPWTADSDDTLQRADHQR